jgi:hypothetical protein
VAVNQLDERYPSPSANIAPYFGAYLPANRISKSDVVYSNSPDTKNYPYREPRKGDYVPKIWRDCSSNYTEVESGGVTLLALIDLYDKIVKTSPRFSPAEVADLVKNLQRGVDYFVSLQESHPGDALRDGRLRHSTLVNVFDNAWWAGNLHIWHDTAFGALILARGSAALTRMAADTHESATRAALKKSANAALTAAKAAWRNANARPYYLAEDLDTKFIPGYDYQGDLWPWTEWRRLARAMYGVADKTWDMAATVEQTDGYAGLRSRELTPFLNASTTLYQVSDESMREKSKYLVTAKRVAAELERRQYGEIESPLDGVVGMFHEFSDASGPARNAFLLESAQAGVSLIGNYDFTSLSGFIDLLTLLPEDEESARWHRTIQLWANGYQAAAAARNPLGIAPVTVYASTQGTEGPPAVYWFGNHLHGGNEIPGQAAHSLLEVGNYLNDAGFYALAVNDVQFYAGVNAGIGAQHQPSTFIKGIGAKALVGPYMEASAPIGSVANGYSSTGSFSPSFYVNYDATQAIPVDSVGDGATTGQESWILHSHSYVLGAVSVEAPFLLKVSTRSNRAALSGVTVRVEYPSNPSLSAQTFNTGANGEVTISSAILGQSAVVRLTRSGYADYLLPLAVVGGGHYSWVVDYHDYFGMALSGLPSVLAPSTPYPVTLTVEDHGDVSDPVQVTLAYAGLASATRSTRLMPTSEYRNGDESHRTRRYQFTVTSQQGDQAYVLRVRSSSGSNSALINVSGTIQGRAGEKVAAARISSPIN